MNNGPTLDAMSRALVQALAGYLCRHPSASDSADGMRRWWLDDGLQPSETELDGALNWMMEQGLIERIVAADGRVRYSRAASVECLADIRRQLGPGAASSVH